MFVVGAGLMGNGIAQIAAMVGCRVWLYDVSEERVQAGIDAICDSLAIFLAKEKISREQYDNTMAGIAPTTELEEASSCDLVVEAVFEDLKVKEGVFEALDGICPPSAILGTNTSAIPISSIAAATQRPNKVVGIHFFSPVPLMRLCEIVPGESYEHSERNSYESSSRLRLTMPSGQSLA